MTNDCKVDQIRKHMLYVFLVFLIASIGFVLYIVNKYPPDSLDKTARESVLGYIMIYFIVGYISSNITFVYFRKKRIDAIIIRNGK